MSWLGRNTAAVLLHLRRRRRPRFGMGPAGPQLQNVVWRVTGWEWDWTIANWVVQMTDYSAVTCSVCDSVLGETRSRVKRKFWCYRPMIARLLRGVPFRSTVPSSQAIPIPERMGGVIYDLIWP